MLRCPNCGGVSIVIELRDADWGDPPPPPEAYGRWAVCAACLHEWQPEPDAGLEPDTAAP